MQVLQKSSHFKKFIFMLLHMRNSIPKIPFMLKLKNKKVFHKTRTFFYYHVP